MQKGRLNTTMKSKKIISKLDLEGGGGNYLDSSICELLTCVYMYYRERKIDQSMTYICKYFVAHKTATISQCHLYLAI